MAKSHRNIAICTYRVKCGEEQRFGELLRQHWKTLQTFGLVSDRQPQLFLGVDESRAHVVVEIFEWLDDGASARAELLPQVLEVWDPMTACCEPRLGHPAMEFPHYEHVTLGGLPAASRRASARQVLAKSSAKSGAKAKRPAAKRNTAKRPAASKATVRKAAAKKATPGRR